MPHNISFIIDIKGFLTLAFQAHRNKLFLQCFLIHRFQETKFQYIMNGLCCMDYLSCQLFIYHSYSN